MNMLVLCMSAVNLGLVYVFNLRGLAGAFLLGISVILVDYNCLWIRLRLLQKTRTSIKMAIVTSGFFYRILNIIIFLLIGAWWLGSTAQHLFHWIIITIPFWNLLGSIKLSNQQ